MPKLLNFLKRPTDSFFGVVFDSKKLTVLLFKAGQPVRHTQEHLTADVVLDGRIVDLEQFAQALNVCIERCLSQYLGDTPNEIYFGVSGNNCVGSTTGGRQQRDPHQKITKSTLVDIYREIGENSLENALNDVYEVTGNSDAELESVFSETALIKLDGTVTYNPIDQTAGVLEIQTYNAYCSPAFVDSLEDAAKSVGLSFGGVYPLQFLLSKKLKGRMGETYDATLISIHSDLTDISIVFGGMFIRNRTLPLGSRDFESDLDFWMDGLELAFLEFSGVKTFSNNIYVCGAGLDKTDFWEMLEWREWEEKIPFKTKPIFTKLDAASVGLPQDYRNELLICGLLGICKELA